MKLLTFLITALSMIVAPLGAAFGEDFNSQFDLSQDPSKIDLPSKQGTLLGLEGKLDIKGNMGHSSYHHPLPMLRFFDLSLPLSLSRTLPTLEMDT